MAQRPMTRFRLSTAPMRQRRSKCIKTQKLQHLTHDCVVAPRDYCSLSTLHLVTCSSISVTGPALPHQQALI